MKNTLRALALVFALMFALPLCSYAEFAAQVKSDKMQVYADQAMTQLLGTVKSGTIVAVNSSSNGIAEVLYSGKKGYAALSDLKTLGGEAVDAEMNARARVYAKASTSAKSTTLSKGTSVKLLGTSGSWALIEKNGYLGYVQKKYVTAGTAEITAAATATPAPTSSVVYINLAAEVKADALKVYKSASESSKLLGTLKKGQQVTVVAYTQDWACLKQGDTYGFVRLSGLKKVSGSEPVTPAPTAAADVTPAPTAAPTPTPTPATTSEYERAKASGTASNERLCYLFLTEKMGFNTAAACGVLSNIYSESGFDPTDTYYGAYGLVQWLGSRLTELKNYCSEHGYDYTSVEGQLYFLNYEIKNLYPKVYSYMLNVPNTAQGAYDAAYYWCYYYEIPASRASASEKRGARARDTYYPKYAQ